MSKNKPVAAIAATAADEALKKKSPKFCFGNITAEQFLREYWQKKPLLIRNAFADFEAPLTNKEILTLAKRDEAESRLIVKRETGKAEKWSLKDGPLTAKNFRDLAKSADAAWTVLVQDTQHFSYEAHALLQKFNFIPHARMDDLMVSYAVKGGGVGPHFDSYDVFLLQGNGQRRWQVSAQTDLRLKPDMPLKILSHFSADEDWILSTGDMLYLPPGFAHHGVAETDDCVTWSVGFRAPSQQELAAGFLDYLRDDINLDGQYLDADLVATSTPGAIDDAMFNRLSDMLAPVRAAANDKARLKHFLGCYLSEPKAHIYFDPPEEPLSLSVFTKEASSYGLVLDLRSRLLYDESQLFLNGEMLPNTLPSTLYGSTHDAHGASLQWQILADTRKLSGVQFQAIPTAAKTFFYEAYCRGSVHVTDEYYR